jgi:formylglycine-generating enzyme required for sulfatase activity
MKKLSLILSLFICISGVRANNILVSNATLTGQNTSSQYTSVQFDMSWENSWRYSAGPKNWDAAWIFVKYQVFGQSWKHATLSTSAGDHTVANDNGVAASISPTSDGKGVFAYRTNAITNGSLGNINWTGVQLRWTYGTDTVVNTAQVTIKVFAVEMVNIPTGPFFIGDGTVGANQFRDGIGYPFQIINENSFVFQNTSASSTSQPSDPLRTNGYSLNSAFPKGYQQFYVMKYEISQFQYMEFFNTLPNNTILKGNKNIGQGGSQRNMLSWSGLANDGMVLTSGSGDRACSNMSWVELCAYADWAALRPMSELEYEKASRGCDNTSTPVAVFPVQNEYAWGNVNIQGIVNPNSATYIFNDNSNTEGINGGCTGVNTLYCRSSCVGPVRVGIFAAKGCTSNQRELTGASYYGVLELSGNVAELVCGTFNYCNGTGSTMARSIHGDGFLSPNGHANVSNWISNCVGGSDLPSASYSDVVVRGGGWADAASILRTSDRSQLTNSSGGNGTSRSANYGGRLVRMP